MNNPASALSNVGQQLGGFFNNNPFTNPVNNPFNNPFNNPANRPPLNQGQMVPWNQAPNQLAQAGNQLPNFMNAISPKNYSGNKMDLYMAEAEICDENNLCDTYHIPMFKARGSGSVRGLQDNLVANPVQGWNGQGWNGLAVPTQSSNGMSANYTVAASASGNAPLQFSGVGANPAFDLTADAKSMNIRQPGLYTISADRASIPGQFRNARLVVADGAGHKYPAKLVGDQLVVSIPISQAEIGTAAARLSPSIVANSPLTPFSGRLTLYKSPLPSA